MKSANDKAETTIVRVRFERYKHGYLATSRTLKGLFISHKSLANVYEAVPVAIKLLLKAERGLDVTVEEAPESSDKKHGLDDIAFLAKAA